MELIKKIVRIIITSIKKELAYPIRLFTDIMLAIIDVFIFYSIWKAIYNGKNIFGSISYDQIITYIILARLLYQLLVWGINLHISRLVKNGAITVELARPVDFEFLEYFIRLGDFIRSVVILSIPIIIIGIFLGLKAPVSMFNFSMFLLSLFGAITIGFLVEFIVGCLTFFTVSSWGLQCFKQAIIAFFSGSLVPIEFMPSLLQNIVNVLPFKSMIYFPVSIYIGNINNEEIFKGLLMQLMWILIMFVLSRVIYRLSIRKVTIAGG